MVQHIIVQAGHLLVPAAAAAKTKTSAVGRILPIIILIALLFLFTRMRNRPRGGSGGGPAPSGRRPRSARSAMREPAASRESDTDPDDRSEHTQAE